MTRPPGELEPDTKDWTWVLERPCPECGLDVGAVERHDLPRAFRANAQVWHALLADPRVAERTRPDRWSTLEYACHVHDVHQVFHDRVTSMLAEDTPHFANWDQDQSAAEGHYATQLPSIVGPTLLASAYAVSDLYASVPPPVVAAARDAQQRQRVHRRVSRSLPPPRRRPPPVRRP